MSFRRYGVIALLASAAVFMTGCATNRSEIKVAGPVAPATAPAVSKARAVVIQTVTDQRVFEAAPRSPNIPSLGFGGAAAATDAVKARAVARKRNTYGKALGDVLVQDGQTVTGLVRENLASAFQQLGYRVARDVGSAGPDPLLVDVRIRKLWSWVNMGFWAITMNADVETSIHIAGSETAATSISVHAEESQGAATDGAWLSIVQKGLSTYREEAVKQLGAPAFSSLK